MICRQRVALSPQPCAVMPMPRCVVLTGAGRMFCAGGDIGIFASAADNASAMLSELAGTLHMAVSRFARMRKPLLVLVNGPAAGAGFSLAMMGDIVLAGARRILPPLMALLASRPMAA